MLLSLILAINHEYVAIVWAWQIRMKHEETAMRMSPVIVLAALLLWSLSLVCNREQVNSKRSKLGTPYRRQNQLYISNGMHASMSTGPSESTYLRH